MTRKYALNNHKIDIYLRGAFFLLAASLLFLGGCASSAPVQKNAAEKVGTPDKVTVAGPSVSRFTDGRQGFVLTELPEMDGRSRNDFTQANEWINQGSYEQAISLLKTLIERYPNLSAPYINMAIAYERWEKPDETEAQLKKALELVPAHPVASNVYGMFLRQKGRFQEARQVYEASINLYPEYMPLRRNLGILCDIYMNDPVCALDQYEVYSEAAPEDEQIKIWIADLRLRVDQ